MQEEKGAYKRSLLDDIHISRFIKFLEDRGSSVTYQLLAVTGTYSKIKEIGEMLEKEGLVRIVTTEKPRMTHTYSLTTKGKKVAAKLKELDELVGVR